MNEEMLKKLQEAKSAEDVVAIAKEHGKEVTLEQAQALLDRVKHPQAGGELSDEDLDAVAGGGIAEVYDTIGDGLMEVFGWLY